MINVPARPAFALIVPLGLMVSACGSDGKVDERDAAAGEILPGSASDAMIPLETLRSQAPLAPRAVPSGAAGGQAGETPDEAATGAAADAAVSDAAPAQGENATPVAE